MSEDTLDGPDRARRDETPAERMDRIWDELLPELRVTQTVVQILSGFLLAFKLRVLVGSSGSTSRTPHAWSLSQPRLGGQ